MRRLLIITLGVLFAATTSYAQTSLPAEVEEDFSSRVAVSGSMVVGAMIGPLIGTADTRELLFTLPVSGADGKVCFSSKTRDGQYWSEAVVDLPEGHAGLSQITPKNGWQYLDQLSLYARPDFAALVRLGQDCRIDPDAPILPVQFGADTGVNLNIALNAQRAYRVSTKLSGAGDAQLDGTCVKSEGDVRSTAFNYLCTFDLPEDWPRGAASLTIDRRTRVGRRSDNVSLIIP